MPRYRVRLVDPDEPGFCWHTDVAADLRRQRLSDAEIERRAVANAVEAFGQQAARWKLLDAQRKR